MRAKLRALRGYTMARSAAAALAVTLVAGHIWAEDKPAASSEQLAKAMAEASKPGPEHAKLQPLVGSWTYTCKFWMDPSQPATETTGTIERKWVLGGRFLEEKVVGTGFDGKPGFEGLGLIGYDKGKQKYTSTWMCSMGTGACNGVGAADAEGDKFTFHTEAYCPLRKKTVQGREELRIEGDKTIAESYVTENGKEVKVMELVAVRKK